jgi:circadian clock protein KaiC
MLAASAPRRGHGAQRIVFDALDVVLALLPNAAARRREVYRIHEWLLARGLTGLITAKAGGDEASSIGQQPFGFMQFMVDCAVMLTTRGAGRLAAQPARAEVPRLGLRRERVALPDRCHGHRGRDRAKLGISRAKVTTERVSSGVARLDTMLGGGFYRGSTILVTGFPGTAKTTLASSFAQAACKRLERTSS